MWLIGSIYLTVSCANATHVDMHKNPFIYGLVECASIIVFLLLVDVRAASCDMLDFSTFKTNKQKKKKENVQDIQSMLP